MMKVITHSAPKLLSFGLNGQPMKSTSAAAFIMVMLFVAALANAQIPTNPNNTDAQGKRQGKWTILFDKNWKPVVEKDSAVYYRLIDYKDDMPAGLVKDYFKSGKLQFTGAMVQDRPEEILTGKITWFSEDGIKEKESLYAYGKPVDRTGVYYYTDGTEISDSVSVLTGKASALLEAKRYSEAIILFEKAKIRAASEFGKVSNPYLRILYRLSSHYDDLGDYTKAEPYYKEITDIMLIWVGKEDLDFATSLINLALLYKSMGNYLKAEPLYVEATAIKARVLGKEHPDYATSLNNLARFYESMGNYPKAEPLYVEATSIRAKAFGKEHSNYSTSLYNLASMYKSMGNYSKAEPLFLEAIEIEARVLGKEHPDYAISLNELASLYKSMGNYSKAEPLSLEAKGIRAKVLGKEHPDYAISLNNLASLYKAMGNYPKAEPLYLEAIEIGAKALGKEHPQYATYLSNLALLYDDMGNYSKAEPLYLVAMEIDAKVLGKEHPDYAISLNNLASLYYAMGNYPKAEPLYLETIEIGAKALGKEHPQYATYLSNLALLYNDMGSYSKAEPLYLEVKEIREKALGKEHPLYAMSLSNLGLLYKNMGAYSKAEPLHVEATAIRAKALGKEHHDYATSLNNLAGLYESMGNYTKAEPLYVEATAIRARALGKEHPDYASSMNNLAFLYSSMGNYTKAEPLYVEATAIRAKALGKEHPDYASSLNNLAGIYSSMGNYPKAEPLYVEAAAIRAKALGKEHPDYASSQNNLAGLYESMGNYPKAEPLYVEAIAIWAKALGKEHPDYATSLNNLAFLYKSMGNYPKAEPLYFESITKKNNHITRYFPSMSENEKKDYYTANRFYFTNFELFCVARYPQNPAIVSEWYNLKLTTKGLLFQASNKIRNRILGSKDKDLIQLYNDWQAKKDFLAKVYQMPISEKQKSGIDEKKLEEEANAIEKSLSLKSELFATLADTKQYRWQDVRQRLKSGEAAIEIVRTEKEVNGVYVPVYAAMIVTAQTQIHPDIVVLENGGEMERYGKYYINHIKKQLLDTATYNQYWKPIANKLKGITKVYFSADGVYNQINLNTLYNPATKKYLMDEMDLLVVTSTKDLVTKTKSAIRKINNTTLFGFPNYNNSNPGKADSTRSFSFIWSGGGPPFEGQGVGKDSAQRFFNGENINELPGTKVEVETIGSILRKNSVAMQEYLYDKATEAEIKKLNNPQVLHIATHGFFLSDLPKSTENGRGFAGMETKKIEENPLLRSGLLFAGAKNAFSQTNTTSNENEEDGVLTSYEAMSLDLDNTDLVVLSACETGLGVSTNGEGVYGLQRAFQVAGAKSVLMSLWTVSDEATQKLMTQFYENWLNGKSPREAFRMAQLALREKYPEPYYWGAFVLVGN
jgi:tetratricopeptide (TPR) repeat protein